MNLKRLLCILLVLVLAGFALSGCDRRSETAEDAEGLEEGNFAPETTGVGGLTQAVEDQSAEGAGKYSDSSIDAAAYSQEDDGLPQDSQEDVPDSDGVFGDGEFNDIEDSEEGQDGAEASAGTQSASDDDDMPFASPTPQPNTSVSRYAEISAPGLGFRFSYPSDWTNIPGRSTVCYVQPLDNGTVYPARVAVTMKRLPHSTNFQEVQTELAEYIKLLRTQYSAATFKVDMELDTSTKFMGKSSIGTTYLAYDGGQEIKGYVVATYFERYMYVFHFLCAYNDYTSFEATIRYMRDSVQIDKSVAP